MPCRSELDEQLEYDLGHLLACYPSNPDLSGPEGAEAALAALATRATQSLVRQIFSLPTSSHEAGRFAILPKPLLRLPRTKPVPQPKPMTKWQKFAQEKGIVKKKRSALVFDEAAQDWKRRHGYKRGNDDVQVPIIEASADDKVCTALNAAHRTPDAPLRRMTLPISWPRNGPRFHGAHPKARAQAAQGTCRSFGTCSTSSLSLQHSP